MRKEERCMKKEGSADVFPVYRKHIGEIETLSRLVNGLYERRRTAGPADDRFFFLGEMRDRLRDLLAVFRSSREEILYVSREDRRLIEKIVWFLKRWPEIPKNTKTA